MDSGKDSLPKISRRDFLKLGGLALGGVALSTAVNPNKDLVEVGGEKVRCIETLLAKFYPVYEVHTNPATSDVISKLPKLDIYFYEFGDLAKNFVIKSPDEILNKTTENTIQGNLNDNQRTHIVPREHLQKFGIDKTLISFEGFALTKDRLIKDWGISFGESMLSVAGLITKIYRKANLIKSGSEPNSLDKLSSAVLIWMGLPIVGDLSLINFTDKTTIPDPALKRVMSRLSSLGNHSHPENQIVFFRNLFMARKLQTLAKFKQGEMFGKPKIGYNVGLAHTGIEDWLNLSHRFLLGVLGEYNNKFWNGLIEQNGGIDPLCSTILLTPDTQNSKKIVVYDKDLATMINQKIS